ncbi:MAG: hypothetical protein ACRDHF_10370 [Tepidiformaceae bacterium]
MAVAAVRKSFRRWRVARAIHKARLKGHGLYSTEFEWAPESVGSVSGDITQWCRDTLSLCRRPLGIDQFDLTLTVSGAGRPQTHRMAFLRPSQLYEDAAVPGSLAAALGALVLASETGTVSVVAALLSWGDIAHATMS